MVSPPIAPLASAVLPPPCTTVTTFGFAPPPVTGVPVLVASMTSRSLPWPSRISVISMSSKVMPPWKLVMPLPSWASLMSTCSGRLLPSTPGRMPSPDKLIGSPSLTTSLRSDTAVSQPWSSAVLESLKTFSLSACTVSSVATSMLIGSAVRSVGSTVA